MGVAVESTGTQSATLDTEHSLATPATAKTRVMLVDLTNLVAGDVVILRIKTKVLTGGSAILAYQATFAGPVSTPACPSVPVACPFGGTFTLEQTDGTGRSYDWAILTLD